MNFGVVLIAAGGFLLGGAYSLGKLGIDGVGKGGDPSDGRLRSISMLIVAVVLVLVAVYLVIAGIGQAGRE